MVEGPRCTLNGEKIRARVQKGQKVVEISGSANHGGTSGPSFQCFSGCEYTGVQTLGKELFLYFGIRALRLHFGMNGSMRINTAERTGYRGNPASLLIQLTKDTLCFFNTTVEIRLSEDCKEKVQHMASLDVSSQSFSVSRAVEVVCKESCRGVCDVLLDQSLLPGVGNIIKNEALFLSALNPAVKVNQLKTEHVQHLVKMTRDFTLLFYQCCKSGSSLNKHCKVYNRTSCGHCNGTITVCRLGEDSRMTYFCKRCQTEDPAEINMNKLHSPKTLLKWTEQKPRDSFDHVAKKEEEEWSCELCTLINRPATKFCEACMSPRPSAYADAVKESSFVSDLIKYPHNSFSKPQQEVKLNHRAVFGNTTLILSDLSCKPAPPLNCTSNQRNSPVLGRGASIAGVGMQPSISKRASPGFPSSSSKRRKLEITQNNKQHPSGNGTTSAPTTPCCPTHHRPSALKVVTKEGENKGRQFYTCSLPWEAHCNFFEWADLHFPMCHHGKRTLKRTVLKLGPNNGRHFYVCPFKQGKQCEFFQWVENGS